MKYEKLYIATIASTFTIIGIIIGSYLTFKSNQSLFYQKVKYELRERSYSNLMGLRVPVMQAQQILYEAKSLTYFYDFRYKYFSKDPLDFNAARDENRRMLAMIPEVSQLQRELSETLADIRLGYQLDEELEQTIESLRRFETIVIYQPEPKKIKTREQLEAWKDECSKQIQSILDEEWSQPIEVILPLLFNQIKKN